MTDGELVRQTLSGRTDAYEELVRRWAARITAVCHAKTGRGGVAEDLAQRPCCGDFVRSARWLNPRNSDRGCTASPCEAVSIG